LAQIFFFSISKEIILNFGKYVGTKKGLTKFFFSPLSFVAVFGSGIQDPGSGMGKNHYPGSGMNVPGSATLDKWIQVSFKTGEHEGG
jgi:hypothetical protein